MVWIVTVKVHDLALVHSSFQLLQTNTREGGISDIGCDM